MRKFLKDNWVIILSYILAIGFILIVCFTSIDGDDYEGILDRTLKEIGRMAEKIAEGFKEVGKK